MGHINITGANLADVRASAAKVAAILGLPGLEAQP
jgi:hypothetical protein